MTLPCSPIIEPLRLAHRAIRHAVHHKVGTGVPMHAANHHAAALPQVTVAAPKVIPPANCVAVPGPLPAGPGAGAAGGPNAASVLATPGTTSNAGAQPAFGGALSRAAGSGSSATGLANSVGVVGGANIALASLPKAAVVAATLLLAGAVAAVPGISTLMDATAYTSPAGGSGTGSGSGSAAILMDTAVQPMAPGAVTVSADIGITPVAVPEPASVAMFLIAIGGTILSRRCARR